MKKEKRECIEYDISLVCHQLPDNNSLQEVQQNPLCTKIAKKQKTAGYVDRRMGVVDSTLTSLFACSVTGPYMLECSVVASTSSYWTVFLYVWIASGVYVIGRLVEYQLADRYGHMAAVPVLLAIEIRLWVYTCTKCLSDFVLKMSAAHLLSRLHAER